MPDEAAVRELSVKGSISPLAARALIASGINTIEKAAEFFGQGDDEEYSDPFLIRDMEKACELINTAVDEGTLICIYGDYDCDGVTATAMLAGFLSDLGADVITYINERSQGYGMNCDAVRQLSEQGVGMIVTVDNGIAAIAEAKLCKELGMTLVITDHHQPGEELPCADAVVDPHRQDCPSLYKDFCGCGLALKLIAAMNGCDMDFAVEQYSDLAAIATIGDVVPLTGENRLIVRHGLHYLENTENLGLRALIAKGSLKKPYTSTSVAFGIVPRINAAGRIGSPSDALRLLMCEDMDEAEQLAEKICRLNDERKDYENKVIGDIAAQIEKDPHILDKRILVFSGEDWHHGVVGIAAARCVEKFGKPVFLMSNNHGETELRGSARSIDGFNIFKALSSAAEHLTKFGGHSGAGGFSLEAEMLSGFDEALQKYAAQVIASGESFVSTVKVSGALSPKELTVENVSGLSIMEPFGEGNPSPVFMLSDCTISEIIPLSGGTHTKLSLLAEGRQFTGLMFGTKTAAFPFKTGDCINVLFSPEVNTFNGRSSVNLRISDLRKKGQNQSQLIAAEDAYYAFRRNEPIDIRLIPRITPQRAELAAVYKAIGRESCSLAALFGRLSSTGMNYCKLLICLDIFHESGLIEYDRCSGTAAVIQGAAKADTTAAPTMKRLMNMNG